MRSPAKNNSYTLIVFFLCSVFSESLQAQNLAKKNLAPSDIIVPAATSLDSNYGIALSLGPQIQGYNLGFEGLKFIDKRNHMGFRISSGRLSTNEKLREYVKSSWFQASVLSRIFFFGSGNVIASVGYGQFKGSYFKPGSFVSRSTSGETSSEGTIKRDFKSTIFWGQLGIGNQWFWKNGVALGADWAGINYIFSNKFAFEGDTYDKAGNELPSRAKNELESALKIFALNVHMGIKF